MARKRKGRAVSGILLLDKPTGLSSNQALQRVRGIYRAQKAGHGGTLDPFAEGLLPILLGEATKFGRFLLSADKCYEVTMAFGRETDTDDYTGSTIHEARPPKLSEAKWIETLELFLGLQMQIPPVYSALKVGGERAYALARKGEMPVMEARPVTIHSLDLLSFTDNSAVIRVSCSKGTYIRALVRDIGRKLGSAAHATALRRCSVGELKGSFYSLETLSAIHDAEDFAQLDSFLLPLEACVSNLPMATIPDERLRFFRHGNDVALNCELPEGDYAFYHNERLLGVGRVENGRAYPERLCALNESANE